MLLSVEKSQLRWFGHLVRMHSGHLLVEVLLHIHLGRDPRADAGIFQLAWKHLWIPQDEPEEVAREKDAWVSLLCHCNPVPKNDERMDGCNIKFSKSVENTSHI